MAESLDTVVLGITTSTSGVATATALAADRRLEGARFQQRDGTDNKLPDAAFNIVWVLESSHLMRDRRALLGECVRVLAPGGRLVLCDIIRKREIPFLEVRARKKDFGTLRAAFGDAHMEPLENYTSILEQLGMTVTDCSDISEQTRPTFAAWRANIELHRPALYELLGQRGVDDFVGATHILESFWQDETLGYGILAATTCRDSRPASTTCTSKGNPSGTTDQDKARTIIGEFLVLAKKGGDGWTDESALWGDGLGLDSLEAAELSAILEDAFGSDPFSVGGDLPDTVADVLAFYAAVRTE